MNRAPIFAAIKEARQGAAFTQAEVSRIDALLDSLSVTTTSDLTPRIVCYCAHEEGMVQEAYKDSVGVWTAFLGVTNASGHQVYPRYKDKPQDMQTCVDVSVWLMQQTYLPAVRKAFEGYALNEAELAAALSFHWNTGAIAKTDWVGMVKSGKRQEARQFLETHYLNGGMLKDRRMREAALFFDGKWPALTVPVYPVKKPAYTPDWGKGKLVDISEFVRRALG